MSFNPFTVIKSLLIKKEGILTPDSVEIIPGSSDTGAKVNIEQTNTSTININLPAEGGILLTDSSTATLTNKTIDADDNTITNIDNADIKVSAAIDAAKIHDGSVSNTEFGYLDGVTSSIQTQLNTNATAISDHISDATGAHAASAISNTPSGNLIATDVQGALNEIQTELDAVVIVGNNAATRTLNNLTTTAINADLLPDADGTRDLGSSTLEFAETHSKSLNRTTAGNLTISVASGNLTLSPSGDIDANNNSIINVPTPTAASHAVNKEYADSIAAGFDPKAAVRVASTADVGGSYVTTPSNGQLTGAATSIDGVTLAIGDRVLLKDQTDLKQNGIYDYTASGEFTRAADSDGSPASEVSSGNFTFATQGTLNSASGFVLLGNGILTLNTDNLDWTQSSGGASGASRFLDNLLSPTAINQDLLPMSANVQSIGSVSLPFAQMTTSQLSVNDGAGVNRISATSTASQSSIDSSATSTLRIRQLAAGATVATSTTDNGAGVSGAISTTTGTGTTNTGNVSLQTGNGTTASGNIALQTGTGTTRGDVTLNARSTQVTSGALNIQQGQTAVPVASQHSISINAGGSDEGIFKTTSSDSAIRTILTAGPEGLPQAQNLIINGDAEGKLTSSVSILVPYADAASSAPVDGSGGSPNVTSSIVTAGALAGSKSYTLVKDAANRQGQGWAIEFNVNSANRGRVQSIKFDYIVNSGIFTAGTSATDSDITVWIYDVSNNTIIQPSAYKLLSNSSSIADQFQAEFQTSTNGTTYRLIYHISTITTNNYTLIVDNIVVSPNQYVFGSPVSDWQSYTPTYTSFGTVAVSSASFRRVGANVQVRGRFEPGTPTAGLGRISLPSGLVIDTAVSPGVALRKVGEINRQTAATNNIPQANVSPIVLTTDSANPTSVVFAAQVSTKTYLLNATSSYFASTDGVNFNFEVPIAGWSSSVQMADQTSTRVVAVQVTGDPASATAGNVIIFPTTTFDTHAGYNSTTGRYTVSAPGYYRIHGLIRPGSGQAGLSAYVNAISRCFVGYSDASGNAVFTGVVLVNSGDIIDLRPNATIDGATGSVMTIERISGPSQIASVETLAAAYHLSASFVASTTVPVNFDTKEFDTHNAVTTSPTAWRFTAPVSGIYNVSANFAVSGAVYWKIYKNGTIYKALVYDAGTADGTGTTLIALNAGEFIDLRPTGSVTVIGGTLSSDGVAYVTIHRIGNRG